MTLPNFIILGAAKSGTSSLWNYLQQHPEIFMSRPKEPNFFVFEGLKLPPDSGPAAPEILYQRLYKETITDFDRYQSLFDKVTDEKAIGEASVRYLYYPQAATQIKKYLPDVKTIALLRNPVDRLYSHYVMNIRHLLEPLPLLEALAKEEERIANNWGWDWHYVKVGLYYNQIQQYLDIFGKEKVKVVIYDDLRANTLGVVQDIYQYVGVDDTFTPKIDKKTREGYLPKSMTVHRLVETPNPIRTSLEKLLPPQTYRNFIRSVKNLNSGAIPPLSDRLREKLQLIFREDILKLQVLLDRELPW
jgi:hypothetical protein